MRCVSLYDYVEDRQRFRKSLIRSRKCVNSHNIGINLRIVNESEFDMEQSHGVAIRDEFNITLYIQYISLSRNSIEHLQPVLAALKFSLKRSKIWKNIINTLTQHLYIHIKHTFNYI